MHIRIETLVKGNYKDVISRFDRKLFSALTPPGADIDIVQFDGSKTGDIVHVRLSLAFIISEDWVSRIVDDGINEREAWFVDEGTRLPFFLSYWKHRHVVEDYHGASKIIDDITFRTPTLLTDWLMYPILYLQFAWRGPVYRRYFGSVS